MERGDEPAVEPVRTFEWQHAQGASTAVLDNVLAVTGDDVTGGEPLYRSVDPDALDALFAPPDGTVARPEGRVEFPFRGHRVVLEADGRGYVYEGTRGPTTPTDARDPTGSPDRET